MPYIDQPARKKLQSGGAATTPGELNYLVTRLVDDYLKSKGAIRYSNINEVIGVLECTKLELYRRIAAPYEDEKCKESGDVYESIK